MNFKQLRDKYGSECIGQVIRILSDKEIIINVGKAFLDVGDMISVYEVGEEIFDLDHTSLGYFEHVKNTLEVVYVTPKFSICQNIESTIESPLNILSAFSPVTKKETLCLDVNQSDLRPLQSKFTNTIKIGDPVKKSD